MADSVPNSLSPPDESSLAALPDIQIEVRHGSARPLLYPMSDASFLVGSVAGCDLRLPGGDLPSLICLISRLPGSASIRKLVPTLSLVHNGESITQTTLADGDTIRIGPIDLVIHYTPSSASSLRDEEFAKRRQLLDAEAARLAEERRRIEELRNQYESDLVRLDRQRGQLDETHQQHEERTHDIDERSAQLEKDITQLREHARLVQQLQRRYENDAQIVNQQREELRATQAALDERNAALETQQVMTAQLRTRVERMREEAQQENQVLAEQRDRQIQVDNELRTRTHELENRQQELARQSKDFEDQSRQLAERRVAVEGSEEELRQQRDRLARDDEKLIVQATQLEAQRAEQVQRALALDQQVAACAQSQEVLSSERQKLAEREAAIAKVEAARDALQEQLRLRDQDLAERLRVLTESESRHAEAVSQLEGRRRDLEQVHEQADTRHANERNELQKRAVELQDREAALSRQDADLQSQFERLKHQGRVLGAARKLFYEEQQNLEKMSAAANEDAARHQEEWESFRSSARDLGQQLRQLQDQAHASITQFEHAREQLRTHLTEVHEYARRAHDEVDTLRSEVEKDAELNRQQAAVLRRSRDEDRLAVASFRQHLIEWQSKVSDMRRTLNESEARLGEREVEMNAVSARLVRQSEDLQVQQREVSERRDVMERHLTDMQEWYRSKLRDLCEQFSDDAAPARITRFANDEEENEGEPAILSLTTAIDSGDRQLGELLKANGLVEPDTLTALLVEARKQRRSLRQVLLSNGTVTLYQLAVIEAGNLDKLVLGPVRILDRLYANAKEVVYRVYDPRRRTGDGLAILRHLAETEMEHAVHPDEFRQRFGAAAGVQHEHVTATLEVLEVSGRPAALQEHVMGLPASDWPNIFAVPGVVFRLLNQAALGLQAVHEAGLVHGHLHPSLILLLPDGRLKIHGLGEPPWLATTEKSDSESDDDVTPRDDLIALGRMASAWTNASEASAPQAKARPSRLNAVIQKLAGESRRKNFASAASLLQELERVGPDVAPNAEAWEQLLRHVRDSLGNDFSPRSALAG